MRKPFFKVVECRNGWLLIQRGNNGRMKHTCGWTSKRVPLGSNPQKYQERLEGLTKVHMDRAHV